jgi:beta-glucosidase
MSTFRTRWPGLAASALLSTAVACAAPDATPSGDDVESDTTSDMADTIGTTDTAFHRNACTSIAPAPRFRDWPRIRSAIRSDPRDEAWIRSVVKAMTLEQKVGQMTQGEIGSLWDAATGSYQLADITRLGVGSILNGGGSWPNFDKHAAVSDWTALGDRGS